MLSLDQFEFHCELHAQASPQGLAQGIDRALAAPAQEPP